MAEHRCTPAFCKTKIIPAVTDWKAWMDTHEIAFGGRRIYARTDTDTVSGYMTALTDAGLTTVTIHFYAPAEADDRRGKGQSNLAPDVPPVALWAVAGFA